MKVAVIMGSDSDYPVVEKTIKVLEDFGVEFEVEALSAHRTHDLVSEYIKNAEKNGVEVIVAAAGKAAHLPGVIAGITVLPVIGLPIKSSTMDGLDSLLSIVQMPTGVPVATVAINGAENAGILAVQILSVKYDELKIKLKEFKQKMEAEVVEKNNALKEKIKNR